MPKGILGKKLGVTQVFDGDGDIVPVTVIQAGPCRVVQKKTVETDGYEALQLGFEKKRDTLVNKPAKGHFAKAGVESLRYVKEIRVEDADDLKELSVGDEIKADIFEEGSYVDVTGVSKGKGFAGVIKRHGFHRGPMEHGSMYHRSPGSLGATDPARVFKGRKLPGRMGGRQVTIQGLQVVRVDADSNVLLIRGSVPGPKGSLVMIRETVKTKS